uniref:Uncharacterized protein n=1 Tax=Arundo donax TaxID=35708 RepID=A0A0A9F733_ARUDO
MAGRQRLLQMGRHHLQPEWDGYQCLSGF